MRPLLRSQDHGKSSFRSIGLLELLLYAALIEIELARNAGLTHPFRKCEHVGPGVVVGRHQKCGGAWTGTDFAKGFQNNDGPLDPHPDADGGGWLSADSFDKPVVSPAAAKRTLRAPLLALGMAWYALKDRL